jgi:hypothetical protein
MTAQDRAYIARDLLLQEPDTLDTRARVIPLEYERLPQADPPYRVRRQNRAILALGAVLWNEGWYPMQALRAAARETQREEIAALNLEALDASARLLAS